MDADEKTLKAIELVQVRLKMMADLGVRGIIFHLAISAFSITFAFQKTTVPRAVVQTGNTMISVLALVATILVVNDAEKLRRRIVDWHDDLGLKIAKDEGRGVIRVGQLYMLVCAMLVAFWIGLFFVP